jgi:UDP-glucose 4-epimerase
MVTGGNGYIGSHMCKLLQQQGHKVLVVDNFSTSPKKPVHRYGEFADCDIADSDQIKKLIQGHKVEAVFHFAARALVPEGEEKPLMYYHENVVKTLSLLDSCVQVGLKKFIFSSTCATFGLPKTESLAEDHPQHPINTYGNTKKLMELAMRDLAAKGLLDIVAFRYFNAAGCSPDSEIGENHDPETHLIPNLCRSYLSGGKETFKLFGTQMPTRDGTCIRDYIHVNDLAKAHYQGLQYLDQHSGFHDFNLGTEQGSSVQEVIDAFEKVTNSKLNIEIKEPRAGDPPKLVSNSTKAKKELAFQCEYTVEDCIQHTLNYLKSRL